MSLYICNNGRRVGRVKNEFSKKITIIKERRSAKEKIVWKMKGGREAIVV